ncbi:hypothetical protein BI308_03980 [Roseofilum reptotaenium AO1-A]|uniref:Uncharacterized protein n=1 Tax=Roseofilum reptotaenium AO1-A TaxID=1925591 RepID=A0A1L9QW43_9CYAN|nr:hypothetical protein [Roseofilum reptotaenium]OJJ26859.1 hypothetical protein BI308_03980 [Roseofilum reptotaenium AO1-A]
MQKQSTFILFLTTTLLGILPTRSSLAFSITPPPSDFYRYTKPYFVDIDKGIWGYTQLDAWPESDPRRYLSRGQVIEIKQGGTTGLLNLLESEFPNWNFEETGNLQGSFDIQEYYSCAPNPLGYEWCGRHTLNSVGAHIRLNYNPQPFSFDPQGDNVHWIQRVIATFSPYKTVPPSGYLDFIDIPPGQQNPYYDTQGNAESDYFRDSPVYNFPHIESFFYAETYLVEEIAPKKVKIYNGVRWGWENKISPIKLAESFSESLSSGTEVDDFSVDGLTPGTPYMAWTNNSLPSNQCNPNTYLRGDSRDGSWLYDENSSPEGDGFASAIWGTVPSSGTVDLSVGVASGGRRGEDEGNYELFVALLDSQDLPSEIYPMNNGSNIALGGSGGGGIIVGGSGGGGIIVGGSGGGGVDLDTPGRTQQNPILPSSIDSDGWQHFSNVPGCRWYDPPIEKGFEFVATDDTLFTEILDFPVGQDDLFTVMVDDLILGEFSPGDRVDFLSLLGSGVSRFKVTDIDYFIGNTEETYFPIQLAFDKNVGSFKMRPIVTEEETKKQKVPESNSVWGLIGLGAFGVWKFIGLRNRK